MYRPIILCYLCNFFIFSCFSQQELSVIETNKYWVFFTDKQGAGFDPYSYFDPKAIERRNKSNIPLAEISDYPVSEYYLQQISPMCNIKSVSRWLNAAVVYAGEQQIERIKSLPFVSYVDRQVYDAALAGYDNRTTLMSTDDIPQGEKKLSKSDSLLLAKQIKRMQGEKFIEQGVDGKGIRIAVFDAGFPWVDTHPAFEHIRKDNRILKTFDFVKNNEFVYSYSSHGTGVLSNIAGIMDGRHVGLATGAEFLLARTEQAAGEPFSEEENWVAAIEWADKLGADMVSSSLGYTYHRYFPEQMDGKTTYISRAANIAARKGILVINAAGNDGSNKWKKLGAPADADSIVTVAGFSPSSDYHISFSSYGPTADMRRKPNVAAYGSAIVAGKDGLEHAFGTSFATPLVSGFAACAWQTKRNLSNMEMFRELEHSGHLYPYYDYAHGYGIPQASYFTDSAAPVQPAFTLTANGQFVTVRFVTDSTPPDTMDDGSALLELILSKVGSRDMVFYHIENNHGYLDKYYVVDTEGNDEYVIDAGNVKPGYVIRMHYKGFTATHVF